MIGERKECGPPPFLEPPEHLSERSKALYREIIMFRRENPRSLTVG